MTIRVLHVIARMNQGGTATYLNYLLTGLEEQGVQTLLCCGDTQGSETESNIYAPHVRKVPYLGREINLIHDLKALFTLAAQVRKYKPDIIHSHTFKAGLLARMLRRDIPKVHTYHGHHLYDPDFSGLKGYILLKIERCLAKRTKVFIGVGKNVVKDLVNQGIGSESEFVSIPPGIGKIVRTSRLIAEKKMGIEASSKFTVLWMGRLTTVKNPLMLLELSRALPHIRFLVGGDGELMEVLKRQAPKNLLLLGWTDVSLLLSASDLVISTSLSEGMPLALIESQLFGKPVIATQVGSVSEIILEGLTGFLVEPNASEFIDKIDFLSKDTQLSNKLGTMAKLNAKRNFSVDVMVRRHIQIYSDLFSKMRK